MKSPATFRSIVLGLSILNLTVSARPSAKAADQDPSTSVGKTHSSRVLRKKGSRSLLCIFDCDEGDGLFGDLEFPCFGIFTECEPDEVAEDSGPTPPFDYRQCDNRTDGIFDGRPLLGQCGVVTEFLDGFFNVTDGDGDGQIDEVTFGNPFTADSASDEPFFLSLFPEGSLLWKIFNGEEDESFVESLLGGFIDITSLFTNGFVDDWAANVTFSNETCSDVVANEPLCLNIFGEEGFWVCRTLYDPFTGIPSTQSVCIDEGEFLTDNDSCGCCGASCPASCPCRCDLDGINDGVLVTNTFFGTDISFGERCVSPEWAVAAVSRFGGGIDCLDTCTPSST